ncbi:hypothetical protein ABW20_dc0104189 [Dactylellina cionopaga]|nr:hypothetical protein ABW20_dc0104189 [Dactylellina cionopaga]
MANLIHSLKTRAGARIKADKSPGAGPGPTMPESLPVDVIFAIFQYLPDYDTLMSLVVASRSCRLAFQEARKTPKVLDTLFFNDAERYKRESFFIARYYEKLGNERPDCCDVARLMLDYVYFKYEGNKRGQSSEDDIYDIERNGTKEMRMKIGENHRFIVGLCDHIVRTAKYPGNVEEERIIKLTNSSDKKVKCKKTMDEAKEMLKNDYLQRGPPATVSERRNIIRGLYRLWLMALIYSTEYEWDPVIFHSGFLDPRIFIRQNPGGQKIVNRNWCSTYAEFDETFYEEFFLSILEGWGSRDTEDIEAVMGFLYEALQPVSTFLQQKKDVEVGATDNEDPNLRYYIEGSFLAFLADDFPQRTLLWIQNSNDPVKLGEILETTPNLPKYPRKPVRYGADFRECISLMFKRGLSGHKIKCEAEMRQGPRRVYVTEESTSPDDCDSWSCIWDDWRLKEWGYYFADEGEPTRSPEDEPQSRRGLVDKIVHGMGATRLAFKKYGQGLKRSEDE